MTFEVRARNAEGIESTVRREAASRESLVASLRRERLLVLKIEVVKSADALPPWYHPGWLRPMTGFEVELGLRQLASMLRSGITILQALTTTAEQSSTPRARRTWLNVRNRVLAGTAFADALAAEGHRFDEIVVRLAEVGERSGELERAITRAADQLESRRGLRTQVVNALSYPVLAITMAIGVSVFLIVSVVPKIAEFLQGGGTQLPPMTQSLVDLSEWVNANGLVVLSCIAAAIASWFVVRLNSAGREFEDVALMRVPIAGRILRLSGTALFARSMEIMLSSGVTLLDALGTAARLLGNRRLRRRVESSRMAVMGGMSLAASLGPAHEFMRMLPQMAAVGETAGTLPETFGETARFHELMLAIAVRRFGMMIEPVMIVITGLIVGYVYIAFFMAIFALAGTN